MTKIGIFFGLFIWDDRVPTLSVEEVEKVDDRIPISVG
jgi:hypothetical protein